MQRMDRATIESFGIPGRVLMENAGRGATAFFWMRSTGTTREASGLPPGAATTAGTALSWPGIFTRKAFALRYFYWQKKTGSRVTPPPT
jgi:hypothetical protein